ncbi:MAG: hypothetical protein IIC25_06595 [Chloroflexi bacterium]|nr:hypothetical protein [Chloroflexota bacterium]
MIKIKIIKKNTTIKRVDNDYLKKTPPSRDYKNKNREKIVPRYMLWFVAFISVVFLFFSLSYMFSKANITIIPKIKNVIINENLSANKDSNSSPISFDLVVISGEENKKVETTDKQDRKTKATNNEQTTTPRASNPTSAANSPGSPSTANPTSSPASRRSSS